MRWRSSPRESAKRERSNLGGVGGDTGVDVGNNLVEGGLSGGALGGGSRLDEGGTEDGGAVLDGVQVVEDGGLEAVVGELGLLVLDGGDGTLGAGLEGVVDVVNDGLGISGGDNGLALGTAGSGVKVVLELLLSLDDGDQVLATTGVVVDGGGQGVDVTVDGLEVSLGGGSITGDEGSGGRDGEENDVGDGNHFGGVVVFVGGSGRR